jgi:hypothetical protein
MHSYIERVAILALAARCIGMMHAITWTSCLSRISTDDAGRVGSWAFPHWIWTWH